MKISQVTKHRLAESNRVKSLALLSDLRGQPLPSPEEAESWGFSCPRRQGHPQHQHAGAFLLPASVSILPRHPHFIPPSPTQPSPTQGDSITSLTAGASGKLTRGRVGVPPLPKSYYLKCHRPDSVVIGGLICILPACGFREAPCPPHARAPQLSAQAHSKLPETEKHWRKTGSWSWKGHCAPASPRKGRLGRVPRPHASPGSGARVGMVEVTSSTALPGLSFLICKLGLITLNERGG